MTQYLLLIYVDETWWANASQDQIAQGMASYGDYTKWLADRGWMRAGEALRPTDQATTVRVRDAERVVTDGPFAETKEQLGGFYLIEVDNLDDAIEAAARCPGAEHGTMEIRPIATS